MWDDTMEELVEIKNSVDRLRDACGGFLVVVASELAAILVLLWVFLH